MITLLNDQNRYRSGLAPKMIALVVCLMTPVAMFGQEPPTDGSAAPVAAAAGAEAEAETAAEPPPTPEPSGSPEDSATAPPETSTADTPTEKPASESSQTEEIVEVPFKSRPYRVRIEVGFGDDCFHTYEEEEHQLTLIREAVSRMYGEVWDVDLVLSSLLVPASRGRLEQMSLGRIVSSFPEQESEKTFFLTIAAVGSTYQIACREYDARIRELTAIYDEETIDDRSIAVIAARLMRDAFRPIAMFVRNVANTEGRDLMELQVQAGAISSPDPSAEQVVEGDVLRTFTRQMERRDPTAVKLLRVYPLSYVRVLELRREFDEVSTAPREASEEITIPPFDEDDLVNIDVPEDAEEGVSRGLIKGIFLTHMRVKLFGAKGRRMQHLAVRQRPKAENSRVQIVLQGRPDRPLVSHRLSIAYQMYWNDPEDGPQTNLVTDRNGEVVISQREGHPTFWLRVYSGRSLLARVPYAPGLIPYDVVELPNDSVRLEVEGEIALMSDDLIDAIAVREVLLARAEAAAKSSEQDTVKELLDAYDEVPGKNEFLERINSIRVPALNKAKEKRLGTRGINSQCDSLQSTIETFFSDQKRAARQQRIQKIKRDAGL